MANANSQTLSWVQVAVDCYEAIRSRRWFIIGVTAIIVAISAVREITLPSYGAETLISVTSLTAGGDLIDAVPDAFEPKTYERLLQSTTVFGLVREQLVEEGHFEGDPPPVRTFADDFWLYLDLVDQTTRPVSFSPIIRLNAKAKSPELAEEKLRAWADIAIEVGNKALASNVNAASETLAKQRDHVESDLEELRAKLRLEKASWNLDVIRMDIELSQIRLNVLIEASQTAEQDADESSRQLESVAAQLIDEKPFREYRKAPSDDAYYITKDDSAAPDASDHSLQGSVMVTQEENLVYTSLKTQEQEFRASEAAAVAKLETLEDQIETAESDLEAQEAALAEHEMEQTRLEADLVIAMAVHEEIAKASSFSDVARSLTTEGNEGGTRAVGLNRISDRIFPVEIDGVFGSRMTVIIAALTGLALIVSFVILRDVGVPLVQRLLAESTDN